MKRNDVQSIHKSVCWSNFLVERPQQYYVRTHRKNINKHYFRDSSFRNYLSQVIKAFDRAIQVIAVQECCAAEAGERRRKNSKKLKSESAAGPGL